MQFPFDYRVGNLYANEILFLCEATNKQYDDLTSQQNLGTFVDSQSIF